MSRSMRACVCEATGVLFNDGSLSLLLSLEQIPASVPNGWPSGHSKALWSPGSSPKLGGARELSGVQGGG
eukprot:14594745-Alexandrium_andersonii.AAC.1